MPDGPRGVFITVVQARSMSSTVATPFVARVIASRFSALYIALNTYPGLSFCSRIGIWQMRAANPSRISMVSSDVEAVSYTHLRAHETVLDLVCRLLLE